MKTEKMQKQIESMIPTPQQIVEHLDKKLEEAKRLYAAANAEQRYVLERLFPQLKESEGERIRKAIVLFFELQDDNTTYSFIPKKDILSWLEKQGTKLSVYQNVLFKIATILLQHEDKEGSPLEQIRSIVVDDSLSAMDLEGQKPADKVEPKFHVGVWITNSIETVQITGYDIDYGYQVDYKGNLQHRDTDIIEKEYHLWNIQDAKDGDILACNNDILSICIFSHFDGINNKYASFLCHCGLEGEGLGQELNINGYHDDSTGYVPATKEQRDLLFQKIKEAGYEWDADKKELSRIYSILGQAADEHAFSNTCRLIGDKECVELQDYLKSLIPQSKLEWSEEDEQTYFKSVEALEDFGKFELADWLKEHKNQFLKPQNTWKPSDEQMGALLSKLHVLKGGGDKVQGMLESLYYDLKKLKE